MTATPAPKDVDATTSLPFTPECQTDTIGTGLDATGEDLVRRDAGTPYVVSGSLGGARHTDNREEGGQHSRPGVAEVSRYLRRIAEQLAVALDEDPGDILVRDEAIRETLPLWGLAFRRRQGLKEPVRDLLSHLLTCLSSGHAAKDDVALRQLREVVSSLGQHLAGTTEKDVDNYIARLEEAGFDLTAPITNPPDPRDAGEVDAGECA